MIGVYAGSFDPITNGHMWLIRKATECVGADGKLIIAVAKNVDKKSMFSFDERVDILEKVLRVGLAYTLYTRCEITSVDNEYLVKFAERKDADFIFRGIRNVKDFDYEVGIQQVNRDLCPNIETIFFLPPSEVSGISSSIVKGMVGFNGWEKAIDKYVNSIVVNALREKMK